MKKALAILLAVLMVIPAMVFTATATDQTSQASNKVNIIPVITTYDMPDNDMTPAELRVSYGPKGGTWITDLWVPSTMPTVTGGDVNYYDASEKAAVRTWEGASPALSGWVKLGYQYFEPIDISAIWDTGAVCFDLYLSDIDALGVDTIKWDFELRSKGGNDENEFNASGDRVENSYEGIGYQTLKTLYDGDLQNGWNHFEIPFTYFSEANRTGEYTDSNGNPQVDTFEPDKTQINMFRFMNAENTSFGGEGENKVMMKNIYFVDQCVYEPHQDDIHDVLDFDNTKTADGNGWSLADGSKYSTGDMDIDGDGDEELALIRAVEATHKANLPYYGLCGRGGGWDTYPDSGYGPKKILNISNFFDSNEYVSGICFDLFVTDTKVDLNGATYDTVAEAGGKKTTLASDLSFTDSILDTIWSFELSSGGGDGKAEISWSGSLKTLFGPRLVPGQWTTVVLRFDECTGTKTSDAYGDFVATEAKWLRMMTGEGAAHGFAFTGDLTVAIDNIRTIRDLPEEEVSTEAQTSVFTMDAYASNKEKIYGVTNAQLLSNQAIIVRRFTENNTTGVSRYAVLKGFDPVSVIGMDTVCFDFYVDVYGSAVTAGLSASDKAAIKTLLTSNKLQMEISSSSVQDDYEVKHVTSVNTLLGKGDDEIPATGWYHIELPFNMESFVHSTGGTGHTGVFNWETVKYITMFLEQSITLPVGVNVVLAMDNVYFKNSQYEAPTADASVYSAQPTLNEDFNLTYTVKTNDLVASNPLVDVTFDGKTTSVAPDANGQFTFGNILAHRLPETITTTITAIDDDHQIIRTTNEYSIKEYCAEMLKVADETYMKSVEEGGYGYTQEQVTALKRLLSDILYYGAAAQNAISYKTDALATDGVDLLLKLSIGEGDLVKNTAPVSGTYVSGPQWRSAALVLSNEIRIRFGFLAESTEDLTVVVDGVEYTDFTETQDSKGNTYYYIDHPVDAEDFGTRCVATFKGNAEYAVSYSVNDYVASKYVAGGEMADLLACIYYYGVAANAFATATDQQ